MKYKSQVRAVSRHMLTITITHESPVSHSRIYANIVRRVVMGASLIARVPKTGAVAVILIGDKKMRTLNHDYRGKNKTTNVLAFPNKNGEWRMENGEYDLGDVFISVPEAKREAKKYGWTLEYEMARLVLHGFLHLLGYDHIQDKDAERMEKLEAKLLGKIPNSPNF